MKYLVSLTAAATILLTQSCLEQRVDEYQVPPQLGSDAQHMIVDPTEDAEPADTKPVICPQLPNEVKFILYNITPARDLYF